METSIKKLSDMEAKVIQKENKKAKLEGALDNVMSELKDKHGIETLDDLNDNLDDLDKELGQLEDEFKTKVEALETNYDWSE